MPDDLRFIGQQPASVSSERQEYGRAILSEIRLLLDYLAGNPAVSLQGLQFANTDPSGSKEPLDFAKLLAKLDDIGEGLDAETPSLEHHALAQLQMVRDALSRLVAPASGLSVAYTTLVTGLPLFSSVHKPRTRLAVLAYPDFVLKARVHRALARLLVVFSIVLTGTAVWESTKVALGKSLLQNLEALRIEQTALNTEKAKLESTSDNVAAADLTPQSLAQNHTLPLQLVALCDRPLALRDAMAAANVAVPLDGSKNPVALHATSAERDTCVRDQLLALRFGIAQNDLRRYYAYWPALAGNSFEVISTLIHWVECGLHLATCSPVAASPSGLDCGQPNSDVQAAPTNGPSPAEAAKSVGRELPACDIELRVAPLLLVWGNYNLPIAFAFLGASIYVILDFFAKLKDSRLLPRDSQLSSIRLVLGAVTGACIGLFFSTYGPTAPTSASNLIGALSLSASAIAFLAGFGVEGVFTMLEGLVSRVFPSDQK